MENRSAVKYGILVFAGLLIFGLALLAIFRFLAPPSTPPPTSFVTVVAPDKSFQVMGPSDWSRFSSGGNGIAGVVRFKNGAAVVEVIADLAGSLVGDVGKAADSQLSNLSGMMPGIKLPPEVPAIQKLHDGARKVVEENYQDYQELPAQAFQSRYGDSRFSEFSADGGFRTGRVKGYRVTMLGPERRIQILCRCTEKDWPDMKASFIKIINSVSPAA